MECSHPRCTTTATQQWSRLATPDEAGGHVQATHERRVLDTELKRAYHRQVIRELEHVRDNDPEFPQSQLGALDNQIGREQAKLGAVADSSPIVDEARTVVAVFGCAKHAVDLDRAAGVHEADCMTGGHCGCHVEMPVPA